VIRRSASGRSKYRAVRTSCGLHEHASKKEARRCGELHAICKLGLQAQVGEITNLIVQPEYNLYGVKYIADFEYHERQKDGGSLRVVEDCKGFKTPVYKLKKTLMKNIHGIEIRET
jgi:hypothetical protein